MDVFQLRDQVIDDYSRYMGSFIEIRDPRVKERAERDLQELWPEPLLQLNPAFEPGEPIDQLIDEGLLHPACREIFQLRPEGQAPLPLRLYRHQIDGIRAARAGDNYVLTTGTGSGKSLSYIVPIVDHVLRTRVEQPGIKAIIVYPMNALANSQLGELEKYLGDRQHRRVTFARYTGQESQEERDAIRRTPPDILLTNYVMLELILTRGEERPLIENARDLRFLVFDELHTYRGRQGADVAMLCRRVRDLCEAHALIHVGTSATLASEGSWDDQRREVAKVASTIFGAPVEMRRVIGETLRRITPELDLDDPKHLGALRRRVVSGSAPTSSAEFTRDPLASWIESTLGIRLVDGRLARQRPRPLGGEDGVARELAALLEAQVETCEAAIRQALLDGYKHLHDGRPVFAFRLHQFVARGDTVYASLDTPEERHLTTQRQVFVPGSDRSRRLLPLCFCRECGQDFYVVRRIPAAGGDHVYEDRDLRDNASSEDNEAAGFLLLNTDGLWPSDDDAVTTHVPESWVEEHRGKPRVRPDRRRRLPRRITVSPLGIEGEGALQVCFIPAPFLFCPRCGVAYDAHQRSDFGKLGTLGSEGRSTATTILSLSTLRHLRQHKINDSARKLLSFTDNRQDAALQAGHFNDFVSLGLVRSGLFLALEGADDGLTHDELPQRVFEALDLPMRLYAQNPEARYGHREGIQRALRRVLGYYLYRDLARGWRLTSPNLEQCGLLTIEYRDLGIFCTEQKNWAKYHPLLANAAPALRHRICEVLLNFLRRELAIQVEFLDPERQDQIRLDANQVLVDPWCLGEHDKLSQSFVALSGSAAKGRGKRIGPGARFVHVSARGGLGIYLRQVLSGSDKLKLEDTQPLIDDLFKALFDLGALCKAAGERRGANTQGYQINAAAMIWRRGDGERAIHDPIRVPQEPAQGLRTNAFFIDFYRAGTRDLAHFEAREHTAQVRAKEREEREERFRSADLPLLFCSPTMELGVDIAELNVVNMRNVPPTPANYAQRSGRAGRSGQPAFVFTYCAAQSPHDHYYFRHADQMVAGEVKPPNLDLCNEDLLRAHVHAIWLHEADLSLGSSLGDLLDVSGVEPTLAPLSKVEEALADHGARTRARARALAALGDELRDLFEDPNAGVAWLDAVLDGLPGSFQRACDRWISLYRAAHTQAQRQAQIYGDRSRPQIERDQAKRLANEANAQLDLLVKHKAEFHSDFYSYRYFASEGFLPGYNFPRLPLSAYLPKQRRRRSDDDEYLSRPRFLAISEFGPRSIIYHEGSRFVISKVILGGEADASSRGEGLCTRALRCGACGAIEPLSDATPPDLCPSCGAPARAATPNLFKMRNVTAHRRDRITSDEEERLRIGYELRTNVHFPKVEGQPRRRSATLLGENDQPLLALTYGHAADIWRLNLGWRRRKNPEIEGFLLDTERGIWTSSQNPDDPDPDSEDPATPQQVRVIPFVADTRNCLLIDPAEPLSTETMASLQAALKSAIQLEFQLEDRELAAEPLPSRDDRRRLLFYEASEGGAGVLRRLVEDHDALARVARRALELSHFDPDTGADRQRSAPDREECEAACYECLLSYFNQPDHRIVDRALIPEILMRWSKGQVKASPSAAPRDDHLTALLAACESELERAFLDFLAERGHHLPSRAQFHVAAADTRLDFVYTPERGSPAAIYVDGPHHDAADVARRDLQQQELLEDLGYLVLRFHHAARATWHTITARFPSVFGAPIEAEAAPSEPTPPPETAADPTPEPERASAPPAPTPAPPVGKAKAPQKRKRAPAESPRPAAPPPPPPPAFLDRLDPLFDLLDLFDDPWHPLLRRLAEIPRLMIDAGEELRDRGRVAASYLARIDREERSIFLIDADDPHAAAALALLTAQRRRGVAVRPNSALEELLAALEGDR